jgi:predicted transcriptional regulator
MAELWRADGWLTPSDVQRALADRHPVAYTTAMTVLVRGWQKGTLERRRRGRAFAYRPRRDVPEPQAERLANLLAGVRDRPGALNLLVQSLSPAEQEKLRRLMAKPERRD